ncbi:ATP-binding protein [Myxococcus sp. K15C18031901]|uniref:ATP-binding protein n=1 Tax=Myxococcus dinghuensis TaxID=2906761 RepID=UPI0020A71CFF|nr:ATP-binding protein [Myxococcus dinghuensis]MCP3105486.1 ATP-binding protein [Myxococcus dinghuensis]
MAKSARFQVDPRLATLLGESYRSSEHALKELVDNAWDADAHEVDIQLPAPMTNDPIIIRDDGTGMTEQEVRSEYLKVASDRRSRKGEETLSLKRRIKGRKGIGKFAGLMAASTMVMETRAHGKRTSLVIRKEDLLDSRQDLEKIDLPLTTSECDERDHGTTITLTDLNQALAFPTAERLRELLVLEYGRRSDFTIRVNGEALAIEDIPGEAFTERAQLQAVGPVKLSLTFADGKRPLKHPGVVVRVGGKVVGKPIYFGLDEDEEVPGKLLKKVYGEIEADGLAADVTPDWGAIIENSTGFKAVEAWAREQLKEKLNKVFVRQMSLAKARLQQEIDRRLAGLPEHRRRFAEAALQRVLTKFYGESEERRGIVINVMLDAFERDEYWAVIQAIEVARHQGVATFADALGQFGLVDMAVIGLQTRRRLEILDRLDELMTRPDTQEKELHQVIERNLWLLEGEFTLLSSNQTVATILKKWADKEFTGDRAKKRPDLLLCAMLTGRHLLIEFKEPGHSIDRDDETQATKYRDDLRRHFDPLDVLVIGGRAATSVDANWRPPGLHVRSYAAVVSAARARLGWLLDQLKTDQQAA